MENGRRPDACSLAGAAWRWARRSCLLALLTGAAGAAGGERLQVLHWWVSASERKAADLIAARLERDGIGWHDSLIPNGSGVGAGIVLRSRMLAKDAPEVAQVNGTVIREWANLHLLLELDGVAAAGHWRQRWLPAIDALARPEGHVVAAPLGIHRINTLFYNRKLFARYDLTPPLSWADFERAATRLRRAGVVPLAQSSEPWQVATLFETLVLAEGGADFYRALFLRRDARAFDDARLGAALTHLRALRQWMGGAVPERSWDATARQLADGQAAMMVMGDWAKGELNAWGLVTDRDFGCVAVPGTAQFHLYNVDTLTMLASPGHHRAAQESLAALVMSAPVQRDFNRVKGSVPVLRRPELAAMDSCARASWTLFASGAAAQLPSLVHRMAMSEMARDALVAELHRFFLNNKVTVAETQRRLGAIGRAAP